MDIESWKRKKRKEKFKNVQQTERPMDGLRKGETNKWRQSESKR